MRIPLFLVLLACGQHAAFAQPAPTAPALTAPLVQDAPAPSGRPDPKVERITHEDAGSRIDEVRYGGETQSISVQPKTAALPEYEIQPTDGARSRPSVRDGVGGTTAKRVWNLFKF